VEPLGAEKTAGRVEHFVGLQWRFGAQEKAQIEDND
jgi:hypothetical protein